MKGNRKPTTTVEREFYNTGTASWSLTILELCAPSEIRIYEQILIYLFQPTMNRNYLVTNPAVPNLLSHELGIVLGLSFISLYSHVPALQNVLQIMVTNLRVADQAIKDGVGNVLVEGLPV
jgi:hypothetical protein